MEQQTTATDQGNRRRFLTGGAIAAAAAVAGVAMSEQPAAAAHGDSLKIGQNNAGTANTGLTGSQLVLTNGSGGKSLSATHSGSGATTLTAVASGADGEALVVSAPGSGGRGLLAVGQKAAGRFESYANGGITVEAVDFAASGDSRAVRAVSSVGAGIECGSTFGPALRIKAGPSMPPASGSWQAGDVVMSNGLWCCLKSGLGPSSDWVKLSSSFVPLKAPKRVYDSRPGLEPAAGTKGKLLSGQERVVDVGWDGALPSFATAAMINLTVTETSAGGWLAVFKNGVVWPGTSSINWTAAGSTVANGTTVALDAELKCKVRAEGSTHFLVDVIGFYT